MNLFTYIVTGTLRNGSRFKPMTYASLQHAMRINLWRGSVWQYNNLTGKRRLLKRV